MSLLGALDPLHNPDSGIVPVEPDERQQVRRLMTVFLDAVDVGVPKQKPGTVTSNVRTQRSSIIPLRSFVGANPVAANCLSLCSMLCLW